MKPKRTLVLGASDKPDRYSFMVIERLIKAGHPVVAIGSRNGIVHGVKIYTETIPITDIHTITLYLSPSNQRTYYDYIISLRPKRIIFNPGTYNPELIALAKKNEIDCEIACNLVLLSTGQF